MADPLLAEFRQGEEATKPQRSICHRAESSLEKQHHLSKRQLLKNREALLLEQPRETFPQLIRISSAFLLWEGMSLQNKLSKEGGKTWRCVLGRWFPYPNVFLVV